MTASFEHSSIQGSEVQSEQSAGTDIEKIIIWWKTQNGWIYILAITGDL